ncbi:hypothetical protein [Flammeovirga kamogawensis]|uniref:Uncharacterized protein n=1 Tax=Flammeovirga kamogawensis TaxID=373891 RepID=A0ABX8H3Y9_9BACT|nr:hypothetical protein [Flammeovirga kamogawensis]MBB6461871.1 hypothetical protein [Flammeovirga kamogawensis]QWG10515.1 hypothetical protein KM029_26440 [Flammeovirga kamogawensis]TRX63624.1 hypothetical protein EO216_24715 [Flammeovirga kamogawensis]
MDNASFENESSLRKSNLDPVEAFQLLGTSELLLNEISNLITECKKHIPDNHLLGEYISKKRIEMYKTHRLIYPHQTLSNKRVQCLDYLALGGWFLGSSMALVSCPGNGGLGCVGAAYGVARMTIAICNCSSEC